MCLRGEGMKFLDFFSGIGGFRLGMEQAEHTCVGHIEIDKYANKSYEAMHNPKEEFHATDIRDVQPGDLPQADCYCFGFPCQTFSVAGKRGGLEDTRGTLFFEVMRLARIRKPKYLFAENVTGLLSHDGGKTFGTILNALGELGYWYEYQVLNSKNHGVPQNRERVFIIGHLRGSSDRKVFPISGTGKPPGASIKRIAHSKNYRRVYQTYSTDSSTEALDTMQGGGRQPCVMITEATKQGYDIANEGDSINLAVPGSETRRGRIGKGIANTLDTSCNQGVLVKGPDDVCNTVRTGGKGSLTQKHNWDVINDGVRIRRLTPKECFRLQGFPDEYFERAASVNSDSQLYKQAGNSVTVPVIRAIAERLSI